MKNKTLLTTLTVVAILAIANIAAAAQGEGQGNSQGNGGQALQARPQNGQMKEVQQAIENNDYNAWVELTTDTPRGEEMLEKINADNFYLLNEMHQARQNGDIEKAEEIATQLGMEMQKGPKGMGGKGQFGNEMRHEMREEVQTAIQNRDYSAWKEAMMPPVFQYINEGNFDTFADMHEAIQNGDTEKAEQLRAQLGLPERPIKITE